MQRPPLWPRTGDVVIIKLTRGDGYELAVCPEAAQIGCESYDDAWSTARALAESTDVDVWFTRPAATARPENELRLLGHYRRGQEIEQDVTRPDCASPSMSRRVPMTRRVSRSPMRPPRHIEGLGTASAEHLVGAADRSAPRLWSIVDVPDPQPHVARPTATEIHRRLFSGWTPP